MTDQQYADLEALYGPEFKGEWPRGTHITYKRSVDGKVAQGTIIWCQEPGRATGKDGREVLFHAQYVVENDLPVGMPDFVNETDILLVD
jgi:hypothetical protein